MEKRRSKRKLASLQEAEIISDGKSYPCVIENISKDGLHMITASKKSEVSFVPETTFELKVHNPAGNKTCLYCEVRWVHINKTPIHGLTYRMGMEIVAPPSEFNKIDTTK